MLIYIVLIAGFNRNIILPGPHMYCDHSLQVHEPRTFASLPKSIILPPTHPRKAFDSVPHRHYYQFH